MAERFTQLDDIIEDEDDCVIFKGSPLYASLVQSGSLAEELEIEQTGHETTSDRETNTHQQLEQSKAGRCTSMRKICSNFHMTLKSWLIPDMSSIHRNHYQMVINDLSASTCLEEDDRDFLQFYMQTCYSPAHTDKAVKRSLRLDFGILACLVAVFVAQCWSWNFAKKQFQWNTVVLAMVAIVVIVLALREGRRYRHKSKCKKVLTIYRNFLKKNERIASMVKKCLRLIQETELISRGFTLVSQRNPLSRLEGSQRDVGTRQCPVLRKLVFTISREAVLTFREMTKKLFEMHSLGTEIDIQGTYLAYEPIQSYGPCLQICTEDAEELHAITDGFSVSALKGISHLFCLHQSEFMKAVVLVQQDKIDKGVDVSYIDEVNILQDISSRLEEWTVSLQKSHDYHSCTWINREPVTRKQKSQSSIEDIYVAVHSLDLHLQAALARVRCLSELTQSLSDNGKTNIQMEDLLQHMQPIRAELESSKGCWEEGINRIEKAAGKIASTEQEIPVKVDESGLDGMQPSNVPAKKIEDYIIEDQVFEGYTDSNEVIPDYEWDKPLSAEEKEKKRREKEEALRMLSELKTVISVRAVETEKREKAAMLKMNPDLAVNVKWLAAKDTVDDTEVNLANKQKICIGYMADDLVVKENLATLGSNKPDEKDNKQVGVIPFGDGLGKQSSNVQNVENITYAADKLKQHVSDKDQERQLCEPVRKENKNSIISSQGVRRLRKSNMLDLSDSDLEEYPDDEDEDRHYDTEELENTPRLGLPLKKLTEDETFNDVADNSENTSDEVIKFRLPLLSLQERLETFSGADFGLTSEIAEKAVARSKVMGVGEETTFGGDVYGECSSTSDEESTNSDRQ